MDRRRLRVGDRVLSINGIDIYSATLAAAQQLLLSARDAVMLTVEYDVSIIGALWRAAHPIVKPSHVLDSLKDAR